MSEETGIENSIYPRPDQVSNSPTLHSAHHASSEVDIDAMNATLNEIFDPRNEVPDREKYTQQRQGLVERIRKRVPEDIHRNYSRAIEAINSRYLEKVRKGTWASEQSVIADLDRKTAEFEQAFESSVFAKVIHGSPRDLGENVLLKSPEALAEEQGKPVDQVSTSSSTFDTLIGNTDFVFANSALLPSRSSGGPINYSIDSQNGYVVPIDIADLRPTPEHYEGNEDSATLKLSLYAENIYSLPDFKSFYARYNAALFETPLEAVNYYKKFGDYFYRHPFSADNQRWVSSSGEASDREHEIALSMKEMFVKDTVYPPFIPEFQFKTAVEAKKVNGDFPKIVL